MNQSQLTKDISNCKICSDSLELGPRPVLSFSTESKIAIIGQAPGTKVHKSGIPWDDASGKNLRAWLGVDESQFYNPNIFAIVPMGFCYPGKGKTGDLPPRKECAPQWHKPIFEITQDLKYYILIGKYAQDYYLNDKITLTECVKNYKEYLPKYICLPHPSPRNNIWMNKNSWFKNEVLPELKGLVQSII